MKPATRIDQTLTMIVLLVLIVGCLLVLQPFLSALAWAVILCTTTWPAYVWLRARLAPREWLAALIMVLLIAITVLAPLVIVGATIAENSERISETVRGMIDRGPPDPPAWLKGIPFGETAAEYWTGLAHDTSRLAAAAKQFFEPTQRFLIASGGAILNGMLQLTLSIFIAYFFFRDGDAMVDRWRAAAARIAGSRGMRLSEVASLTVRGVVVGFLGTALAQGVLMAVGLSIAGFQSAPLLGVATFFLSPIPIGPPLIWIPAGLWLLNEGQTGWGIFVLLWGFVVVSSVDNIIKPMLISRGSDLPFIVVLLGVLGGAIAFGLIGVFLGPVLLAVGYALLREWSADTAEPSLVAPSPSATIEAEQVESLARKPTTEDSVRSRI
ncbi:MAG: AI-2E family transporter [Betaproteobacteria bacterium]|nr:AI-2E family transporter [Betaproteobacteria bacterium]MBA3776261.1 AI-2E family transporter [Betaproteobacteria bacterium]